MERVILKKETIRMMSMMGLAELKDTVDSIARFMNGEDAKAETLDAMIVVSQLMKDNRASSTKARWYSRKKDALTAKAVNTTIPQTQSVVVPHTPISYPTTPQEVVEIARRECQRMSVEDAELYLLKRQSLGWRNNAGQPIQNIVADVKMWAMRTTSDARQQQANNRNNQDFTKHVSQDYTKGIL